MQLWGGAGVRPGQGGGGSAGLSASSQGTDQPEGKGAACDLLPAFGMSFTPLWFLLFSLFNLFNQLTFSENSRALGK